jgi:hypothetical protein
LSVVESSRLQRNFFGNLRETSLGDELLAEERRACGLPSGDDLRIYIIRNGANDFNRVFWMKIGQRTTDQAIERIHKNTDGEEEKDKVQLSMFHCSP